MRTRIKFCGMTQLKSVRHAIDLGIDALGFVFVNQSPRNVTIERAQKLVDNIPPFVMKVGLFMNAEVVDIQDVLNGLKLNLLQFHGEENEAFCKQFNVPYLKAIPMGNTLSVAGFCLDFPSAAGFVLDSHTTGQMGGSGEKFAWNKIPGDIHRPIVLAGGLTPDNVVEAVRAVRPYAVDVSSGIEASEGVKDLAKMEHFVKEVKRA